jgi:hypothetical protein
MLLLIGVTCQTHERSTVKTVCDCLTNTVQKAGVIHLATVSDGGSNDRNVHLSVDVSQLNVTLLFQNGTFTRRIFIRGRRVLVSG